MPKTLNKTRHNPRYKVKLQSQSLKDNTPSNLLQKLQNFKQKLLSGNSFVVYK